MWSSEVIDKYLPAPNNQNPDSHPDPDPDHSNMQDEGHSYPEAAVASAEDEDDYDDEDYVPESLRGFLEEADKQLQAHKDDVLNFDEPAVKNAATPSRSSPSLQAPHKPKAVPNPEAFVLLKGEEGDEIDDDDDDDDEIFKQILQKEGDQQLAQDLLEGIQQDRDRSIISRSHSRSQGQSQSRTSSSTSNAAASGSALSSGSAMLLFSPLQDSDSNQHPDPQHQHPDFLSPAMSDITTYTNYENNPAAHLTESQAKRMAMEGVTPYTSRKAATTTSTSSASATKTQTPHQPRNLQAEMEEQQQPQQGGATTTTATPQQNWIGPKGKQQLDTLEREQRLALGDPSKDPIMESIVEIPTPTAAASTSASVSTSVSVSTPKGGSSSNKSRKDTVSPALAPVPAASTSSSRSSRQRGKKGAPSPQPHQASPRESPQAVASPSPSPQQRRESPQALASPPLRQRSPPPPKLTTTTTSSTKSSSLSGTPRNRQQQQSKSISMPVPRASPPISQPPTPLQSPINNVSTPRRSTNMVNATTSTTTNTNTTPRNATTIAASKKAPIPGPSRDVSPQKVGNGNDPSSLVAALGQWPVQQAQRPKSPPPPKQSHSSITSSSSSQAQVQNYIPDSIPNPPSMLDNDAKMQLHVDSQGGVVVSKRRPIPADKGSEDEPKLKLTPKSGRDLHPKAMAAAAANNNNSNKSNIIPYDLPQPPSGLSVSSEPSPEVSPTSIQAVNVDVNVDVDVDSNTPAAAWKPPTQQQQQKNSKQQPQQQQQPPMSIVTQSLPQRSALAQQQRSRKSKSTPATQGARPVQQQVAPPPQQQRPKDHPPPAEVLVKSPISNASTMPVNNSASGSQQQEQEQRKPKVPSYMQVTRTAARRMDRMRPSKLDIPGGGGGGGGSTVIRQARSKPTPESSAARPHARSSTTGSQSQTQSQQSSSMSGYSGTTATIGDDTKFSDPYGGRAAKVKLQKTALSNARLAGPRQTTPVASSSTPSIPRKNDKSSPMSSRRLQGTAASHIRESKPSSKDDSDQQATRDRVRARVEAQKQKKLERNRQIQERIEIRQRQTEEKKEKIQQSLQRGRERREKIEQQERDRIAKLEAKLLGKENNHPTPSSRDGPLGAKLSGPRPKYIRPRKVTPTIPLAPKFATDSRVSRRERPKRDEGFTLANSDELLKHCLRRDEPTPVRTSGERPALTIPHGPKLATAARHGDKTPATPIPEVDGVDARQWQGGLRSASSSSAAERPHKLTIPHTPKFQEIKKRELPKSTTQKEMEVIEYYKSHPFKANPLTMQELGTPSVSRKKSNFRITTPEPFHLSGDDRAEQSHEGHDEHQGDKIEQFRARPMPDFSATKKIPLTGMTPNTEKKKLTQPQPFHFHSVDRVSSSEQSPSEPEGENVQFRARPVPNFVRHSGLVIHRDPTRVRKSYVEPTPQSFKARPMPNFSTRVAISPPARKAGKPLTTPTSFQFHTEERASHTPPSSTTHGSQAERFKARAMPNFAKATIPVRDVERTRSPPKHVDRRRQEEPQPKKFRAKPMPKTLLEPSIPVRERNSPPKKTTQEPQSPPKPFRAKPLPKSSTKPTIPVKGRDSTKLRSPDAVMRPEEHDEDDLSYVFKARPVPDFSRPKRDPPIRKTVIQDPQGASPPKASARVAKSSLRARMVERQSGSTASSSRRESSNKFSSSKVKQRLKQAKTVPYGQSSNHHDINDDVPIVGDMGMLCGVPTSISMPGELAVELVEGANALISAFVDPRESMAEEVGVAAKKQTDLLQHEVRKHQEKERVGQAKKQEPRPPRQEVETESKRQLRAATEAWIQESQSETASSNKGSSLTSSPAKPSVSESRASPGRHAADPPSKYTMTEEERAREEALLMSEEMEAASQAEASEQSRREDFLQQAYEVERAAEDEISYHGSSRHERTIGVDPSDVNAFWNYNGSRR